MASGSTSSLPEEQDTFASIAPDTDQIVHFTLLKKNKMRVFSPSVIIVYVYIRREHDKRVGDDEGLLLKIAE